MIVPFGGKTPRIAESAWIGPGATIIGDVAIGERSSVWPGAVIRGDYAPIRIGADVNVQDNAVIHCDEPLAIGDGVTIGHAVVVHGREIGDGALIGNNATLMPGVAIGAHSIVGAGALAPPRMRTPPHSLVLGVPGQVRELPLERFAGSTVHAVCGIGNPDRFLESLAAAGVSAVPHLYEDHHDFAPEELDFGDGRAVIMTPKDAVKCRRFAREGWYSLEVEVRMDEELARDIVAGLCAVARDAGAADGA